MTALIFNFIFYATLWISTSSVEYFPHDVCRSQGYEIRPFLPVSILEDFESRYMKTKCECLQMYGAYPEDIAPRLDNFTPIEASFNMVVLGSGPSALTAVKRLSELGKTVLLVDHGPFPPKQCLSLYYRPSLLTSRYVIPITATAPDCDVPKLLYISKVVGGVTSVDSNGWNHGCKKNYDEWGSVSDDWGWDKVSKYYKKVENTEVVTEVVKEVEKIETINEEGEIEITTHIKETEITRKMSSAFEEVGYSHESEGINNPMESLGNMPGFRLVPVMSDEEDNNIIFAEKMLEKVKDNGSVKLALETEVISIKYEGNRATAVEVVTPNGNLKLIHITDELIITTGPIASVPLLSKSGIGDGETLRKLNLPVHLDLPALGKDLAVNPIYLGLCALFPVESLVDDDFTNDYSALSYLFGNKKMSPGMAMNYHKGFLKVGEHADEPDVQLNFYIFSNLMKIRLGDYLKGFFHFSIEVQEHIIDLCENHDLMFIAPQLLNTKSRGSVSVHRVDGEIRPLVDTGMYRDPRDMEIMLKSIEIIRKLATTSMFRELNAKLIQIPISNCDGKGEPFSVEYDKCSITHFSVPNLHPTGALCMGKNKETSVVDDKLLVHGTQNIRAFTPGVVPHGISSDSAACASMIGNYGADIIAELYNITTSCYK